VPITIQWSGVGDVSRCALAGELDLTSEPRVRRALFQALGERPRTLVIDMADVTFIDSTGLRALLSTRNRAATTGTRVVLAEVGPSVERTLEIANLGGFFEFEAGAWRPD